MGWGDTFSNAYDTASDTAKQAAEGMMSSAHEAGVAILATASAVAEGTANVVGFGLQAVGETVLIAGRTAVATTDILLANHPATRLPYRAARQALSAQHTPRDTLVEPCPTTYAGKRQRLEARQQLIRQGRQTGNAAADRLERNNEAVELARLSKDVYDQGAPGYPGHTPPLGWSRLSDAELAGQGIHPALLQKSQAVIYQTPPDWPGGQKTVLAFRGTADLEDAIVDHDQALGLATTQYAAAALLGPQVQRHFGADVLVTGHSLGGGKAQAAGVTGQLQGTMFNAAGLHPLSTGDVLPTTGQFQQFRTSGDPLTAVQNSAALQMGVAVLAGLIAMPVGFGMQVSVFLQKQLGMSELSAETSDYADKVFMAFPRGLRNLLADGQVLPPALGTIHEVPAIGDDGQLVSTLDVQGQHSIDSVINGIEQQKVEDMATLTQTSP